MKTEYEKLIADLDKTLLMLRSYWMESTPELKTKWMDRINSALDERCRLMDLRDGSLTA